MDNKEMLDILFTTVVVSVKLKVDDGFADDLEHASTALEGVKDATQELIESLEASNQVECINSPGIRKAYWADDKLDRVKLLNDVEVLQLSTRVLVESLRQYIRNNKTLLIMGDTKVSFSITGNPLLPDIRMSEAADEEIS